VKKKAHELDTNLGGFGLLQSSSAMGLRRMVLGVCVALAGGHGAECFAAAPVGGSMGRAARGPAAAARLRGGSSRPWRRVQVSAGRAHQTPLPPRAARACRACAC